MNVLFYGMKHDKFITILKQIKFIVDAVAMHDNYSAYELVITSELPIECILFITFFYSIFETRSIYVSYFCNSTRRYSAYELVTSELLA